MVWVCAARSCVVAASRLAGDVCVFASAAASVDLGEADPRLVVVDSEKVPTLSISAVACADRGIDDARLGFDGYRASFRIRRIMRVVYKAS
jgi:hypothetical protein